MSAKPSLKDPYPDTRSYKFVSIRDAVAATAGRIAQTHQKELGLTDLEAGLVTERVKMLLDIIHRAHLQHSFGVTRHDAIHLIGYMKQLKSGTMLNDNVITLAQASLTSILRENWDTKFTDEVRVEPVERNTAYLTPPSPLLEAGALDLDTLASEFQQKQVILNNMHRNVEAILSANNGSSKRDRHKPLVPLKPDYFLNADKMTRAVGTTPTSTRDIRESICKAAEHAAQNPDNLQADESVKFVMHSGGKDFELRMGFYRDGQIPAWYYHEGDIPVLKELIGTMRREACAATPTGQRKAVKEKFKGEWTALAAAAEACGVSVSVTDPARVLELRAAAFDRLATTLEHHAQEGGHTDLVKQITIARNLYNQGHMTRLGAAKQ